MDKDWITLLQEARDMGIDLESVKEYLRNQGEGA